jgi:hypothetical protein
MKSMTIHGIDGELEKKLAERSKQSGLSRNRFVKFILQKTLLSDRKTARREMFSDLFGKWTENEKKDFEERIKELNRIDASDWQE